MSGMKLYMLGEKHQAEENLFLPLEQRVFVSFALKQKT